MLFTLLRYYYPCRLSDRCQNSQCRPPGNRREGKDPIQAEDRWKAGSLPSRQCTLPYGQNNNGNPPGNWNGSFWHIRRTVPIWPQAISTNSEGSNQTCKACGLRTTTPSSRLFGNWYGANHKPFLKRASGCFQNVGKNVLTPEGCTLKTSKCLAIMATKKLSVPVIFEPPCIMVLPVWHYTTTCAAVGKTVAGEERTCLGQLYQLNQPTVSFGVWTTPFFTVEERVFILESYLKTMSYVHCRQSFWKIWKVSANKMVIVKIILKNSVKQVHFWTRIVIGRSQC